jgi:WD40 repeat protein
MSKIFISHSQQNNAAALAIAQWLGANGWGDYFLDVARDRGIAPGERWQEALRRAADRCQAVLFLISGEWLASRWCLAEFLLAKQLGKVIFGVLISDTPIDALPIEMRGEFQLCNLLEGADRESFVVELEPVVPRTNLSFAHSGLARLRWGLERAGLDPLTFPWPPTSQPRRSPFRGLLSMDAEDAAVFFGRDASITLALDSIRRLRDTQTERVFVVLGASGTGKSSFLRAGLLPRLKRDDRNYLMLPVIRPERAAITGPNGLINCLEDIYHSLGSPIGRGVLRKQLSNPSVLRNIMADLQNRAQTRLISLTNRPPAIVVAIDQAEELFTSEHQDEAETLLQALSAVTEPSEDNNLLTFVLLAIRSDSYERLQTHPTFTRVKQHVFSLQPIPREEYRTIIEGPAERHRAAGHRLTIDPLLTRQLLQDTQGADALPLLAFTLERLFLEQGAEGELSLSAYETLGGIGGSIQAAVTAAFSEPKRSPEIPVDEVERRRLLRMAFIPWLARVDPDTDERKRRVAAWNEIPLESQPVIDRLIEQRLLTRDRRLITGSSEESVVVEVAHEALLRRWPILTAWLDQDADALRAIEVCRRAALEWVKHGKSEAWLDHSGDRLRSVEALRDRADLDRLLGEEGRLYLRACQQRDVEKEKERAAQAKRIEDAERSAERDRLRVAQAEAEQNAERAAAARRLTRRTLIAAGIVTVLMLVAVWSAISANRERRAAEHSLGELSVAEASRLQTQGDVPKVLAYLARAVRLDPDDSVWRAYLIRVLLASPWVKVSADLHTPDPVEFVVFSPGGKLVFVAAGDTGHILDCETGRTVGKAFRHHNVIIDGNFSPDGKLLVTGSRDRTVRIWNATDGQPIGDPIKLSWVATQLGFSKEGKHIVASDGYHVRVLRLLDHSNLWRTEEESKRFQASLSPDASLAVVFAQGRASLWNIEQEQKTDLGIELNESATSVTFSQGGGLFAIRANRMTQVFSSSSGSMVGPPSASPYVSLDDRCSCGVEESDEGLTLSDARTGRTLGPIFKPVGRIEESWVMSRGARVVTVSEASEEGRKAGLNEQVQIWDSATGQELAPDMNMQRGSNISTCENGQTLLAWSGNVARVWKVADGTAASEKLTETNALSSATLSPDCASVVTTSGKEARWWDLRTGALIAQPLVNTGNISSAEFSPDHRRLITTSSAGAQLWDLRLRTAKGHALWHPAEYDLITFSPNGDQTITASGDRFSVWDSKTGTEKCPPLSVNAKVGRLLVNANGDRLLVSSVDGLSLIYDTNTCKSVGRPMRIKSTISLSEDDEASSFSELSGVDSTVGPELSPDGSVLLEVVGKAARLWDIESGKRLGKIMTNRRTINSVAFSDDGRDILTASEATVQVWSARSGEPVGKPMHHSQAVSYAAFSADGNRVCSTADRMIAEGELLVPHPRDVQVWNARTGQQIGPPIKHDVDVEAVALSPDGSRVITAADKEVRVWDSATGIQVGNPIRFQSAISSLAYAADGRRIFIAAGQFASAWDAEKLSLIGPAFTSRYPIVEDKLTAREQKLLVISSVPHAGNNGPNESLDSNVESPSTRREGWLFDVPTGVKEDGPLLTALAELIGGYRINELGALETVSTRSPASLEALAKASNASSTARRLTAWILATDGTVSDSPFQELAKQP